MTSSAPPAAVGRSETDDAGRWASAHRLIERLADDLVEPDLGAVAERRRRPSRRGRSALLVARRLARTARRTAAAKPRSCRAAGSIPATSSRRSAFASRATSVARDEDRVGGRRVAVGGGVGSCLEHLRDRCQRLHRPVVDQLGRACAVRLAPQRAAPRARRASEAWDLVSTRPAAAKRPRFRGLRGADPRERVRALRNQQVNRSSPREARSRPPACGCPPRASRGCDGRGSSPSPG